MTEFSTGARTDVQVHETRFKLEVLEECMTKFGGRGRQGVVLLGVFEKVQSSHGKGQAESN